MKVYVLYSIHHDVYEQPHIGEILGVYANRDVAETARRRLAQNVVDGIWQRYSAKHPGEDYPNPKTLKAESWIDDYPIEEFELLDADDDSVQEEGLTWE